MFTISKTTVSYKNKNMKTNWIIIIIINSFYNDLLWSYNYFLLLFILVTIIFLSLGILNKNN